MTLTDDSPMPFGQWEGKPMYLMDITYLNFVWNEMQVWTEEQIAVKEYIKEHLPKLKSLNPTLKWK